MEQMSDRQKPAQPQDRDTSAPMDGELTAMRVVTVGEALPDALPLDAGDPPNVISPDDISAETLAALRPDVVLTPLVGAGFDCLDVAVALCAAGYRARLRAVVRYVPNPGLVRREIAASCPGLDFDLIVLGPAGRVEPGQ
jgi:hypothetical protein